MFEKKQIMNELNIDVNNPSDSALFDSLVDESESIIKGSLSKNISVDKLEENLTYQRAVKTLITQLYYDRELSGGLSRGLQMMINHLVGSDFKNDEQTAK